MVDCQAVGIGCVGDDGWTGEVEVAGVVEVMEGDWGVFERVEVLGVLHSEKSCDAEGVDEEGGATFD